MNKKNIILAIVLAILIAAAWGYNGPYRDWQAKRGATDNFFKKIDFSQVTRIDLAKAGLTTTLERSGEKWKISGTKEFFVRDDMATGMSGAIEEAKKADLEPVSQNKDKKGQYGTDINGTEVKLYKGSDQVAGFIVGNISSDYMSTYVSQTDSDNTYLVKAGLNNGFAREEWYDRTIFSSDQTKINKIRFQIRGQEFVIEKKGESWEGTKPKKFSVDKARGDELATLMANMTAVEIPEQTFANTGLEKNEVIVQATGEGVDNTIMIGRNNGQDKFFAKRGNSDNIYLISKEQESKLNTKPESLK